MTIRFSMLALLAGFSTACDTPTVVVDSSQPRVTLDVTSSWSTAEALTVTVEASAPSGRAIAAIRLHVRAGDSRAVQATSTAGSTAVFCLRALPTTPCPATAVALDLPTDFGADDAELLLLAEADDDAPARRLGRSGTVRVSVVDTLPPTIELIAQEAGVFPGETLAIRALAHDAHSGISRVRWALRLVSNGCVSQSHSGTLEGLLPGADGDTALITLPIPAGLRSGQVEVTELVAIDGAAAANEGAGEPGTVCIGSCVDSTGPSVSISTVFWRREGGERVALNPGDAVHPNADLEVTVRATDAASSVRSLWAQTNETAPPAGTDEVVCPDGEAQRSAPLDVRAPAGVDGEEFSIFAGAYDDFGAGADHNHGALTTPFNLVLVDDVAPTITSVTLLDANGQGFATLPPLGSTVRLRIDASDRFGLIEGLAFHLRDQDDQVVGAVAIEPIDPPVQALDGYVTTARVEMPNPNTLPAQSDWKLVVAAVDNAEPENQGSEQISFLPPDPDAPVFTGLVLPSTQTLAANRQLVGSISGHDVARYVARVGLVNLQVGATGVSATDRFTDLAANQVAAQNIAVSLAVPIGAREGQVTVTPSLRDDSGNTVLGPPATTMLIDDIAPQIISAAFNAATYQPGQQVQLTVRANDANSLGIARVSISGPDQITWQSTQSALNPGDPVTFTGTIPEDVQLPENGLIVSTSISAIDRAQNPNSADASASTQILDTGGPLITITANSGGDAGATATVSVRARDVNGNVKRIRLSGDLNRFPSGTSAVSQEVSWGGNDQADQRTHDFIFALPTDLAEGLHNLQVTAWDYADNQTPPLTVPVPVNDALAPHTLSISVLDDPATTGETVRVRVSAADQQTGIGELRLLLSGAAGEQNPAPHPCAGSANCTHIFTLPIPAGAAHGGTLTATAHATDAADVPNLAGPAVDSGTVSDNDPPTGGFTNVGPVQVNTGGSVALTLALTDLSSGLTRIVFGLPPNCGSIADTVFSPPLIGTTDPAVNVIWEAPSDCRQAGSVQVTATVHDDSASSGHLVDSQAVTVVDVTPPTLEFRATTPDSGSTGTDLTVNVRIRDRSSGAERVVLSVSPACATVAAPTTATWTGRQTGWKNASFTITGTEDCPPGDLTVTLTGRDQAGNDGTPVTHPITLSDTSGPNPFRFLTAEPLAVTVGQPASLQLEAQDPSSGLDRISFTVPCGSRADLNFAGETSAQTPTVSWTSPTDCRTLGSQQITATGHDREGNTSSDTLTVTIGDTTAPTVAWIGAPPATVSIADGVVLTVRGEDPSSGVKTLTFSVLAGNGSFNPSSVNVAGAPISADETSTYSAPVGAEHQASVTVNVTATDVSDNVSGAAGHTMTFVDDVAPIAITQTNNLAPNRALAADRYAVAVGETVSFELGAEDPNSGIDRISLSAAVSGGGTTLATSGDLAGASPAAATLTYAVPAGLAHATEIAVTVAADDVSDATGFTDGQTITLVVDSQPPAANPVLNSPAVTTTFGTSDLRCLLSAAPTVSGTAGADAASVRVRLLSLPALNVVSNETTAVAESAWSIALAGLVNRNAYRIELSAIDAVGNEGPAAAYMVRADLEDPPALVPNSITNTPNNAGSGRASYQPLLTGMRSSGTGATTVTQARFETCIADGAYATDLSAGMPGYGFDAVGGDGIAFQAADTIDCSWRIRESFCSRITETTGSVTLSKANLAPLAASLQEADGQSGTPTVGTLRPLLSAQYNDVFEMATNEISFASQAEVEIYRGLTRVWTSGERSFTNENGERFAVKPPMWRPHQASGPATHLTTNIGEAVIIAAPDSTNDTIGEMTTLSREFNAWSSVSQTFDPNGGITDVAMNQAMIGLASDVILWILPDGDHYFGTFAGGAITWSEKRPLQGLGGGFLGWDSVRLAADPNDADGAILFAAWDENGTIELHSYRIDAPSGGGGKYAITQLSGAADSPPTVGADLQVAHILGGAEFRVMPGTGSAALIGGTLNGDSTDWTTNPVALGGDRTFGAGAAIVGNTAANTYLVLLGGAATDGLYATAALSANDAEGFATADLPAGLAVGGAGQRLSAGSGSYEPLLLAFDAGNTRLRPVSFDGSDGALTWVAPPDPDANEAPIVHGEAYTWDIRFTDEAAATGAFLGAGSRQPFVVNW